MKKQSILFVIVLLFATALNSCGKTGCFVKDLKTGQTAADNNCNGIPDFQEGLPGGGGSVINQPDQMFYVLPIGITVSTTTLYKSNGNISPRGIPFALCYNNAAYSGNSYDVSTQYRSCTVKTLNGTLLEGIADQNLLINTAFEADVNELMTKLQNFVGNKSELQVYRSRLIPVFVVGGNGTIKGTTSFNNLTGELAGDAVAYSVKDAVEWKTVGEVYGF